MSTANFSIPMNVSDAPSNGFERKGRPSGRVRGSTVRIVIRREDHIGDGLGFIFLESGGGDHDAIIERLREYLGPRIRILKAEIGAERIEVEAGGRRFADEASRLAEAGEGLRRKGASRNAMAHFNEALALDPLNVMALRGLGALFSSRQDYSAAFRMLCKAREAAGDSPEVLHDLGRAAAGMGRIATAIVYLERGCELAPDNLAIRRTLADLGRKPRSTMKLKERAAQIQRDRENGG
jgi:tetratricopeptide (TPR) repeat protein